MSGAAAIMVLLVSLTYPRTTHNPNFFKRFFWRFPNDRRSKRNIRNNLGNDSCLLTCPEPSLLAWTGAEGGSCGPGHLLVGPGRGQEADAGVAASAVVEALEVPEDR